MHHRGRASAETRTPEAKREESEREGIVKLFWTASVFLCSAIYLPVVLSDVWRHEDAIAAFFLTCLVISYSLAVVKELLETILQRKKTKVRAA